MAHSERRVSLGELIRHAGVSPATTRQPCLSPPPQPSNISNEEDRIQAREILVRRRQKNPESKDAMLKRIFKSSKEKDKVMDTSQWEFSQDELDQALSAVIRNPDSNPGLVQALLNFGAKVNYVDTTDKKKSKNNAPSTGPRRRSTVLQQAATLRKVDSVNLLACSGADQTTLDEGLKAALTAQDQPCIEELLRHGADLNRFSNALPAAVQSNDPNLVQILLRAPKRPRVEVISSCLLPAVRQDSETLASLLLSYGADPNFDSASAINTAIGKEDWRLTLTLVSGPIPLGSQNLQRLLDTVMRLRTCEATLQFLQILLCCGLPPNSIGLPDLLICRVRKNCTPGSRMMINYGVPTTANDAECLRLAVENANWVLVDAILETPIEPRHASAALDSLPSKMLQSDRVLIVQRLLTKGAGGRPLGRWLNIAVKEHDLPLLELLLKSGTPVDAQSIALQTAIEGGAGNLDVIQRLLAVNSSLLGPALESTIALEDPSKKKPLIDALLKLGIPQEALDQGLTAETRLATKTKDLSTTTVLMRQGASVSGDALETAISSRDQSLINILLSGKRLPSRSEITKAFRFLFLERNLREESLDSGSFVVVSQQLLTLGVEQPAIDAALRATLDITDDSPRIQVLLEILLQHNANANSADGVCFLLAAQKHSPVIFEKLLKHQPNFSLVISALLGSKITDQIVVDLMNICFRHGCTSEGTQLVPFGDRKLSVLIMAMQRYPRDAALLKTFLNNGWDPNIAIRDIIDPTSGEETIPALLWGLLQPDCRISDSLLRELLDAGASATGASPASDVTPLAVAAREGRSEIVLTLLNRGADPSIRDKWNRSALFYASSTSAISSVRGLAAKSPENDGSLHEASRCLHLEAAKTLLQYGHSANFPSRLHGGRTPLGELCLHAEASTQQQRAQLRQMTKLLLDNGSDALFKARNEKSSIILALDNKQSALEVTEALLETNIWETINDENHAVQISGLTYSPLSYVEQIPAPHRTSIKPQLIELLLDKGCRPRFYSLTTVQPSGAIGIPAPIARLVDQQKEHDLALKLAQDAHERTRTQDETIHRDILRRTREQQDAEFAAQNAAQAHWQQLEQQKHEFEIQRVQAAERMKRAEKVAWHNLMMEQERDAAATRQRTEERKHSAIHAHEAGMLEQRKAEIEHRAGVERRMLRDKEELYERNVTRQKEITKRLDESAQLHARLKQERPAIEGHTQWGTVD